MNFEVDQTIIDEVNTFVNKGSLVDFMNEQGLSISAMAVILQAIIHETDRIQDDLDTLEN